MAFAEEHVPSVAAVVKRARVSRNTFYEYFDDLEHVRAASEQRGRARLVVALQAVEQRARTPVERWRELSRAWLAWLLDFPAEARLATASTPTGLSSAGRELEAALMRSFALIHGSGLDADSDDALRVRAAAAAAEVLGRSLIAEQLTESAVGPNAAQRERFERALVDVAVRLLR